MRKQILVIGGSYFTGRVFTILSSRGDELELHVVNRGRYKLNYPNVHQYICDRHEAEKLPDLLPKDVVFDACIDFCGYEPLEIGVILKALPGRIRHYIFFSTASVYKPGDGSKKIEGDEMLHQFSEDAVSDYILKKCLLEVELDKECREAGIPYTILRPAFIYGPFNYAPRESYFIKLIAQGQPIPYPVDATSKFNFVYVMDIAEILRRCIGNEKVYNEVYNLSAPEDITYRSFYDELERCSGKPLDITEMTVAQVNAQNVPLPYPLDENELYSGEKICRALDFEYTPLSKGMDKTFAIFMDVFSNR